MHVKYLAERLAQRGHQTAGLLPLLPRVAAATAEESGDRSLLGTQSGLPLTYPPL